MSPNGKFHAFTNLVSAYQTPIYNLCALMLGDGPPADHAAQECFNKAYIQFNKHDTIINSQNWLLQIAYQQCRSQRVFSLDQNNRAGVGDSPISLGENAAFQSLLAMLEPEDRVVIALRYSYRLELSEIALVMGTVEETVKNQLRQAQKTLVTQHCQKVLNL